MPDASTEVGFAALADSVLASPGSDWDGTALLFGANEAASMPLSPGTAIPSPICAGRQRTTQPTSVKQAVSKTPAAALTRAERAVRPLTGRPESLACEGSGASAAGLPSRLVEFSGNGLDDVAFDVRDDGTVICAWQPMQRAERPAASSGAVNGLPQVGHFHVIMRYVLQRIDKPGTTRSLERGSLSEKWTYRA
jgi:hypothetical protein